MPKPSVSVIIVNYQADEYVSRLQTMLTTDPELEVIVIDNTHTQQGYNTGCNIGAGQAQGEYLVWMNPDILISPQSIYALVSILQRFPQVGMVGPQLLDQAGEVQITCSDLPTPWCASIIYSWLGKLSFFKWEQQRYRLFHFSHRFSRTVPVISGACFAMRMSDWQRIGKFDEALFLYFEEFDLSARLRSRGQVAYYCTHAKALHYGQVSTSQTNTVSHHFQHSRRYWLAKTYGWRGWLAARWLEIWEH